MGNVRTDYILSTDKAVENLLSLATNVEKVNNTIGTTGDVTKNAFREGVNEVVNFNRHLADQGKAFTHVKANAAGLKKENQLLKNELAALRVEQSKFIDSARYEEVEKEVKALKLQIGQLETQIGQAETKSSKFGGVMKTAFAAVGAYFAIDKLMQWGTEIFNITSEFQKFETVLTNSLGSGSVARQSLEEIRQVAKDTPFSVAELSASFVKLAGAGIVPTTEDMIAFSDVASSAGKTFDQMTEAAIDAMRGENERLKEMNISAERMGKTTAFTFRGITTEVENSEEAIVKYLVGLGKVEGVAGASAVQMQTLGGMVSNFQDTVGELFLAIGGSADAALKSILGLAISGAEGLTVFVMALKEVPGWLKENQLAIYALLAAIVALNFNGIKAATITLAHTAAEKARSAATTVATAKQWLLNAALTANPIGLVIAAIAGLVTGLVLLYKNSDKARAIMLGLWAVMKDLFQMAVLIADTFARPWKIGANLEEFKKLGSGLGDAYSKGYNESIEADRKKQAAKDKAAAAKKAAEAAERAKFEVEQAEKKTQSSREQSSPGAQKGSREGSKRAGQSRRSSP